MPYMIMHQYSCTDAHALLSLVEDDTCCDLAQHDFQVTEALVTLGSALWVPLVASAS